MVPYMTTRLRADYDLSGELFFVNITTGGYGLRCPDFPGDSRYLLGLMNSRLLDTLIKTLTNRFHGGYFAINKQALERLPIRPINFSDPADVARHDKMVSLVESMLELHKRLPEAKTPGERGLIEGQIAATDEAIDRLVYELYGLTEEEIGIVEGRGN